MPIEDPDELGRVDEEIRRNEIRARAEERRSGRDGNGSPEAAEQFLDPIDRFDRAPTLRHFDLLVRAGIEMPDPATLDDESVTCKLWDVINGLARIHTFLSSTDHLSDRELYSILYHDVLQDETKDLKDVEGYYLQLDLVDGGAEEDVRLWLTYYADAKTRAEWALDWPDEVLPPHQVLPFDRDLLLPRPPAAESLDESDFDDGTEEFEDDDSGEEWKRGGGVDL